MTTAAVAKGPFSRVRITGITDESLGLASPSPDGVRFPLTLRNAE